MNFQRRLNYTGRKRINKTDVQVQLIRNESGATSFSASVDFSNMKLPADAPVFIEVRQRDLMQRFQCGTVGSFKLPAETLLTEVDGGASLSFWVRVLDPTRSDGRLLAVARSIHPEGDIPDEDEGRDSLLPVKQMPLGNIPWMIDFPSDDEGVPKLVVNSKIPDSIGKVHGNALIQGYLLPAAIKEILARIYMNSETPAEETWQRRWLQYGKRLTGADWPSVQDSETEEAAGWIDDVVGSFCDQFRLTERILQHEEGVAV